MLEENPLGGFRQGPRGPRGSRGFQGSQAWDNILSKMFPNSSSLRTWDMDSPDSKDWRDDEDLIQDPKIDVSHGWFLPPIDVIYGWWLGLPD